ncbi:MAG: DUF885 domain-containing protein [Planctomycetes bacterium]|nr:DUF885 domain-containing protein [Planctomycetota bacterium]
MNHQPSWRAAACGAIIGLAACAAPAQEQSSQMPDFIRAFRTDEQYVSRFANVRWSEPRSERLAAFNKEWQAKLDSQPFESLSQDAKIDWLLVRNQLALSRSRQDLEQRRLAEMAPLLPFRKSLQDLEWARRRLETCDPKTSADAIATIPDQIKKVRERIEKGRKPDAKPDDADIIKVTPQLALRTAGAVDGLVGTMSEWAAYHEQYKPDFAWWVRQPREQAERAMREYAKFLRETVAGVKGEAEDPLVGDPIGKESLLGDLAFEMIGYSPEEMIRIAEKEFVWCETEMKRASAQMGSGEDWKAALAKVKQDYVPPGGQDEFVKVEARKSIAFLKEHDLVTIPPLCEESWRIEMLSQDAQKSLPFAVYGGQHIGVSYPTETMPHDDKLMSMRGNNRHFTHIVVPHELIPGHHLQGYCAERFHEYRDSFSTPFLVEGWALYWEMRLWDLYWGQTPEDRIGMLFWRMHRCARIIVSLKFHLGEMSPKEMIDFLVDQVGHERFGATSEVRRYIGGSYSPLYQCGYMIGGLQLRSLYKDLVESKKMTDKQFNDTVLTYGPIPVDFIRAGMTNAPLARDSKAAWKFAGE